MIKGCKICGIKDSDTLNFIINISKYIYYNLGFDEKDGKYDLGDFVKNKMGMAAVFENFALNFYKSKLLNSEVRSELIKWDSETEDSTYPTMKTDITIRNEKSPRFLLHFNGLNFLWN